MDHGAPHPAGEPVIRLADCHFDEGDLKRLEGVLGKANGMVVFSGPPGCGKTTTLYACVQYLATPRRKTVTIEQTSYGEIPWATRLECSPAEGLTQPVLVQSALRTAPDVLMVTTLEHPVTLRLLLRAGLTRQLVLSQCVADNPAAALLNLQQAQAFPFAVTEVVRLVVGQRLVRRLCPECSEPLPPSGAELAWLRRLGELHQVPELERRQGFRRPVGCIACGQSGFVGHRMIAELLPVTEEVAEAVRQGSPAMALRQVAFAAGARHLAYDGVRKAELGLVALADVRAAVGEDEFLG